MIKSIVMRNTFLYIWSAAALVLFVLFSPEGVYCKENRYDIVYIWDQDLEAVLDYKEQLESLFDKDIQRRLKVVGRKDQFGIIYDTNESSKSIIEELVAHDVILNNAGLQGAQAVIDVGYYPLYNVSYGLGPNLDSLKKTYDILYNFLGKEVGKNLFIEKTDLENYTLIYRRRGDRKSTLVVSRNHAKLLRSKKIRTSITPENNNEVVFGESSLLDVEENKLEKIVAKEQPQAETPEAAVVVATTTKPPQVIRVSRKKKVLRRNVETAFERDIEGYIKTLRRKGKIRSDEKTSWMVYDLEKDISLVDINSNQLFQAASMIKPFVALAFFHQVKEGKLVYGPKSKRMMEKMIQRSSNSATNWVMRQVGGPYSCQKILKRNYSHIFKKTVINEYIPASGRTYRNSALPSDYVRFLRELWNKKLPHGKELRRIMALPGRDRLYHGTPIPQGTLVYNKTGSTAHLCGDMGILVPKKTNGRRYPYAIVGIIERSSRPSNYGSWMLDRSNVIREVSTLVYEEMKKKHRLL